MDNTLNRFLQAQTPDYATALQEIKNGRKRSHWMWYIFPQIDGLGYSSMAKRYAIKNLNEAVAYLEHPVLGKRLIEISAALLELPGNDAYKIFGNPDNLKLHSSMTLFASLPETPVIFQQVLDKFFNGEKDDATLKILVQER